MKFLKAIWEFCSYLFVPQRRQHPEDMGIMGIMGRLTFPIGRRAIPSLIHFYLRSEMRWNTFGSWFMANVNG